MELVLGVVLEVVLGVVLGMILGVVLGMVLGMVFGMVLGMVQGVPKIETGSGAAGVSPPQAHESITLILKTILPSA